MESLEKYTLQLENHSDSSFMLPSH